MKTLTEFPGVILRQAAQLRAQKAAEGLEGESLAEALGEALRIAGDRVQRLLEALDVAGSGKLDNVRLVRVYQGEDAPPRAKAVGEFRYVVDWLGKVRTPRPSDEDGRKPRRKGRGPRGEGRSSPGRGPKSGPPERPAEANDRGRGRGRPEAGKPGRGPGRGRGGPPGKGRPRGERGDDRGRGRDKLPSSGAGWSLTRAPREDGDRRGRGGPRRRQGGDRDRPSRDRRDSDGSEVGARRGGRGRPPRSAPPDAMTAERAPASAGPEAATTEQPAPPKIPARTRPEATASSPDGLVQRRPSTRPARKPGRRRSRKGRGRGEEPNGNQAPNASAAGDENGPQPGNEAPPTHEDANGNVATPPPSDMDDGLGNR